MRDFSNKQGRTRVFVETHFECVADEKPAENAAQRKKIHFQ